MREGPIVTAIQKALRAHGVWVLKTHGESMQIRGIPDLLCCVAGRFVGLEVKVLGEKPTPLQAFTMAEMSQAGAIVATVHSVQEALLVCFGSDVQDRGQAGAG